MDVKNIPWQKAAQEAMEQVWQDGVQEKPGFESLVGNPLSEPVLLLLATSAFISVMKEKIRRTEHPPDH